MHKAIVQLNVKSVDEDRREIRGIATTGRRDRVGDEIDPLGVRFAPSVPLLVAHSHDKPVGTVRFEKPTKDGVAFLAKIPKVDEPGPLKDRVDTAFLEVKHGLIDSVSVGFRPIDGKVEPLPGGGLRYLAVEIFELSLVAVPANRDARVLEVRAAQAAKRKTARTPKRVVIVLDGVREKHRRHADAMLRKQMGGKMPHFLTDDARANWIAKKKAEAKARGALFLDPDEVAEGMRLLGRKVRKHVIKLGRPAR